MHLGSHRTGVGPLLGLGHLLLVSGNNVLDPSVSIVPSTLVTSDRAIPITRVRWESIHCRPHCRDTPLSIVQTAGRPLVRLQIPARTVNDQLSAWNAPAISMT